MIIENIYFTICVIIMMKKFWKVFISNCEKDLEAFNYVSFSDVCHNSFGGLIVATIYFLIFTAIYYTAIFTIQII